MNKIFYYGEYEFPQDIKDLYFGLPGTGILRIFLDQYIQETESTTAKVLKDTTYDDASIYKWNGRNFAFALQFLNKDTMREWEESRKDFIEYVENVHGIRMVYSEKGTTPSVLDTTGMSEHMIFWSSKKHFFEDLPKSRGMDPRNLITGIPQLLSDN